MPRGQGQLQRDLDVFAREDETTRNEITRRAKALYAHARAEVNQGAAELPKLFPRPGLNAWRGAGHAREGRELLTGVSRSVSSLPSGLGTGGQGRSAASTVKVAALTWFWGNIKAPFETPPE